MLTQLTLIKFQPNVRDKLTALEAQLTCQLPGTRSPVIQETTLSPVLGLGERLDEVGVISKDTVNIQKDCGDDNICIPDLKIIYSR